MHHITTESQHKPNFESPPEQKMPDIVVQFTEYPIMLSAHTTNIIFKYSVAVSLSFAIFIITGLEARRTAPEMHPLTMAILQSFPPYSFAVSRFPAPSSFPTIIPPPEATPRQKHAMRFLAIFAIEFAATAPSLNVPLSRNTW